MIYFLLSIAVLLLCAILSIIVSEKLKFKICSISSFISTLILSYPLYFVLSTGLFFLLIALPPDYCQLTDLASAPSILTATITALYLSL